ncbi:Mediator of RNA polymerase II transcription subunit 7 [Frankliniella fusca]|uniref:Mediator of RNA polymerase II transcription subunit 7 n=1 Tax=Frankliniella fusca TaxID=407009 RepID=A0AAE1LB28_9NEOP|nr:Mediator of RNA polymerase II transcription subunit 7 [Frankliniella fusca]
MRLMRDELRRKHMNIIVSFLKLNNFLLFFKTKMKKQRSAKRLSLFFHLLINSINYELFKPNQFQQEICDLFYESFSCRLHVAEGAYQNVFHICIKRLKLLVNAICQCLPQKYGFFKPARPMSLNFLFFLK